LFDRVRRIWRVDTTLARRLGESMHRGFLLKEENRQLRCHLGYARNILETIENKLLTDHNRIDVARLAHEAAMTIGETTK
jgi:hypothetical protein